MEQLDLAIRTLYAEFQEAVFKRADLEHALSQEGSFVKKHIKNKEYWYSQQYQNTAKVQHYLGPATPQLITQIEATRNKRKQWIQEVRRMKRFELRRAAILARSGLPRLDSTVASLMDTFSKESLIHHGGILIGSYAFASYAGMFGCLFNKASIRTLDIDIACGQDIQAAIPRPFDLESFLTCCTPPLVPIPGLSAKEPPYSFSGPRGVRIDLLTPLRGKQKGIVRAPGIRHAGAQALRFLDFLITNPIRGILIAPRGGIPVTVPHPARFAIHKLIISTYRSPTESAKRAKDLSQATQLIPICFDEEKKMLTSVYAEAMAQGKQWRSAIQKALSQLPSEVRKLVQA